MKWTGPGHGDRRIVKRFLFIPLKLQLEVRWLEIAKIEQVYRDYMCGWKHERFID